MKNKKIAIITDSGAGLGQGHLQRMLSLGHLLSLHNSVLFVLNDTPPHLPLFAKTLVQPELKNSVDLIIRDMRDSSVDDIEKLRIHGTVVVIDDEGEGRNLADHSIHLLPHFNRPLDMGFILAHFLYGYNFVDSVAQIQKPMITKDIDAAIYLGMETGAGQIDRIVSCIDSKSSIAVLQGTESYLITEGKRKHIADYSYAEMLLRSKVLITYFGITLFEGNLSGCSLITINPTHYHSTLTAHCEKDFSITNAGILDDITDQDLKTIIHGAMASPGNTVIKTADIISRINSNHTAFENYIEQLCLTVS